MITYIYPTKTNMNSKICKGNNKRCRYIMYLCSNIYIVEYYIVIAYHLLSNIEVYVVFILRFMYVTKHPCFKLKSYKIYCTLLLHLTLFDDVTFIYKAIFRIRISDGKCRSLFGKLYCVGTELVQITLTDFNKLAHEESFTMLIIIVEKFHVHKYVSKSQSIFIEVTSTPITLNVAEVKNSKLNHCDEKNPDYKLLSHTCLWSKIDYNKIYKPQKWISEVSK